MEKKEAAFRLTEDQLSVFCYQLFLMLEAGIGVEEGVSMVTADTKDPKLRSTLDQVYQKLSEGEQFSAALSSVGVFPDHMIRMVEIGQASGRLDQVLNALSSYYKRESETRQNLRRAVAYPSVMALLIAIVFLVLVVRVLPVFQQVFLQMGTQLSPVAQALLNFGSASQGIAAGMAVILAMAAIVLFWLFRSQKGSQVYNSFFSKTASGLAIDRSRFASSMSMMLSSGLPLDESMDRTVHLLEGSSLAEKLHRCQSLMERGEPFAKSVESAGLFSGLEVGLLAAGSRAGLTDQAMAELAVRCQEESDRRLDQMLGRFEYGLVVVLCLVVGVVLLSVMLPLLGALSALGG